MRQRTQAELTGELAALRDFFAYNAFVRKKYLDLITKLPRRTRTKDRGASYPSLLDILAHVLDAYRCWLYAYETGDLCRSWSHTNETGEDDLLDLKGLSVAQIRKFEKEVDNLIGSFTQKLRAEDVDKSFQYTLGTGKSRRVRTRRVGDMLWHLIEEELQHRGELNALLWQDDIEPPVTNWFDWKKALD